MYSPKVSNKAPVMICTYARGGMRSVVEGYKSDGLTDKWAFRFIWSHKEGSFLVKNLFSIRAWLSFVSLLLKRKVSFVHIHSAMKGSFWRKTLFSKTAHLFGVPTIIHLHGSEMESFYYGLNSLCKRLVKWSLETTQTVIVLSESWRIFVQKIAPEANVVVVNNYVRPPITVDYAPQENRFNVLFLGVLGHRKGIYDLIHAWAGLIQVVPYAKLLVGGNGEIDKAQELANELGLQNSIEFLGWVTGEDKLKLLNDSDVFVLPSYNEGLPMSVLEAMSWRRAVITTTVGGIPELIKHGNDGFLIEPGDRSSLLRHLQNLAIKPQLRVSVGNNARQKINSEFSQDAVLPLIEEVYNQIRRAEC